MNRRKRFGTADKSANPQSSLTIHLSLLVIVSITLLGVFLWVSYAQASESVDQRRQRIEEMDPNEKAELLRRQEEFEALAPEEQDRINRLHKELENDPNGDELRDVMQAYAEWFRSLSTFERNALADLPPDQRIEQIKKIRSYQARQPTREDLEGLEHWIREYSADPDNQAMTLPVFERGRRGRGPGEGRRDSLSAPPQAWLTEQIVRERLRSFQSSRPSYWYGFRDDWYDRPEWPTDEELADLRGHLSEKTAKRLELMPADEQLRVISEWVRNSWDNRFSGSRLGVSSPPPEDLLERLDAYFQELPESEQDRLLRLPHEEMRRQLESMYVGQFSPTLGIGGRGFGRGTTSPGGRGGRDDVRPPDAWEGSPFDLLNGGRSPDGLDTGRDETDRSPTDFGTPRPPGRGPAGQ
jgi:hypothetical protein